MKTRIPASNCPIKKPRLIYPNVAIRQKRQRIDGIFDLTGKKVIDTFIGLA